MDNKEIISEDRDATEVVSDCYVELSKYVARTRAYAGIIDGMKSVYRRAIYSSRIYNKKVKSASLVGECMKYHPHGDSSQYSVIVEMACKFGKFPLYDGKGNFGGLGESAAAMRYTEAKLSDIARLMYLELIDYAEYIDGEAGLREPKYLPALIPYCLLVGTTSIPVGLPVPNIPAYNPMELIDYYISYLENKECKLPTPDYGGIILNCSRDETIDPLTRTGSGKLWFKGNIIQEDYNKFVITEETPKCSFWKAMHSVESWIDQDLVDYRDETDGNGSRHVFIINNTDKLSPDTFKDKLDRAMKCSQSYNFILEYNNHAYYCGFEYIVKQNIKYLRECAIRKYKSYLESSSRTMDVLNAIEAYKASGKISEITKMTKTEVKDIIVGLGFDEDVANKAISKPITYLTKSHYEEIESIKNDIEEYKDFINNPDKYLLTLYYKLKDMLSEFYESREHSVVLAEIDNTPKYAIFNKDNMKIIVSNNDEGISWNRNLYLVCDDGTITSKYVSPRKLAEIDLLSDNKNYKYMISDKGDYAVVVIGRYITVKKLSDIEGSKIRFKIWDDSVVTGFYIIKGEEAKIIDEEGNEDIITLANWEKSRISYPSKAMKNYITSVESIS